MDKKAIKILTKTFWQNGWRDGTDTIDECIKHGYLTQAEFEYAKQMA